MQEQKVNAQRRFDEFMKVRQIEIESKLEATRMKEKGNIEHASQIANKIFK